MPDTLENNLVSVLMCVHNGLRHLPEAVESILNQTYTHIEFIVVDDGSTDGSSEWLAARAAGDDRIKLIRVQNGGLTKALNAGLRVVVGTYVARMDADDVAHGRRLEQQLNFLNAHNEVVCCGTGCRYIDERGSPLFVRPMPQTHEDIEECHLTGRGGFILHPSAMIRTRVLKEIGGYDEALPCAQDYDLWFRLAKVGRLANLPDVLMDYRLSASAITQSRRQEQEHCRLRIIDHELHERGLALAKPLRPEYDIRPADPWWVLLHASDGGFWRTSWRYCLKVILTNVKAGLRCCWRMAAAIPLAAVATLRGLIMGKNF